MLHSTALAFTATVPDLLKIARDINSGHLSAVLPLASPRCSHLIISYVLISLFRKAEKALVATYQTFFDALRNAMSDNKLNVIDLHKRYGEHEVLKGVSLQAKAGDVISVSSVHRVPGKYLLRCINFLEKPSEGTIIVSGRILARYG